jgi:hypothetical protein
MAGLTCICQPDGMTANCELPPANNWEGVVTLMMCILMAVLAMQCGSDTDYESEDDEPPSDMYR